ncbi:MAG: ribosome biogenesis GTPase YqeH [Furfurilactobacillus sp.]|jgi:ribosome biogenesis GTPase YqeH|uniref:ribosome biogenesis GTPase YqeH n=1 Tax=Furfurilactobacillus TaxID=2767882 RepID=UPI001EEF25A2|nr:MULTISPECIES: ribosome biogenesis GTPase YqeH [Furfurilactobacillus]MCF6420243.1 ribosome biogenesis GTPase YqeH [Furfurilactobacillus milii]MCH4010512.1 ribosome biogenesis GTPase YqeH [Furfurilactobacillus sp.]MCH4036404.1 ribosome biogenesis GTPase YqeH [Furfurilactobacillus sp.]MCH4114650.1 ribosome biogenesis GTPase YqeH [Furfurilactobacillus sp.]MCH4133731.1 ribosome biogenesis GTPase YqeH [Furfurilactobacillus sp.]
MSEAVTNETSEPLYCIGCGAKIQTTDSTAVGYTPQSALKKGLENGELYCQRCFRLRHYNEIVPVSLTDDDFRRLLAQIRDANALIVYVVDIFDFNGSMIPGLHRFVGDNPILLVGNKEDVLPRSLKRSKLTDWVRQQANANGLRPLATTLLSAKNGRDVDDLLTLIDKYRGDRDVYVVGVTNVGKSTLINQILKQNSGVADLITTSRFPGTTLDKIEIPLGEDHVLVDTPGIIHPEQMAHFLSAGALKYVAPQKEIKPRVYQLQGEQTLFMGAVARFDLLFSTTDSRTTGVSAYFENNLMIHRTKLAHADDFYRDHAGEILTPPSQEELADLPELTRHEFRTTEKSDLVIEGLGWITVPANVTIAGWAPKGVNVLLRRAMI